METHKLVAIAIYLMVAALAFSREASDVAAPKVIALGTVLLPILFYRIVAFFSGFGFPEYFAKDFKSPNHPGPYALFFWILFLIGCGMIVFRWSIY
ncbi:MAG: hypothetical protein H6926_00240 [Chromatiales bacterium]|nr:hypothetical protein [Gammaproteobacteria bacterium]MCP5351610.1 hypothetical protein [Chromatiales bacterium]